MEKQHLFILFVLFNIYQTFGQDNWILLKDNLQETDTIELAVYSVKYLCDSADIKIYDVISISNACTDQDYYGHLATEDLSKQSGQLVIYYDSLHIKKKGEFLNGEKEGEWVEYYKNQQIDNKGKYKEGKMQGLWYFYFENGQLGSKEYYRLDELYSVEMWDSLGVKLEKTKSVFYFPKLNEKDINGSETFEHLKSNLRYPQELREKGISGVVLLQYCIDKNGNMKNLRVLKSAHPLLDKEALRVMGMLTKWIPCESHNRKTEITINHPIRFITN